ncbi:MAG: hypothetical protein WCT19_03895 [Candidatus Paceibacterota bacterium]
MKDKIDFVRTVANWCLGDWLFDMLPAGTYYLTLTTQWNGPEAEKPQMGFIREELDGHLSGMTIEGPTSQEGLQIYARCHGFQPTDQEAKVFVLRKQ